MRSRKTALVTCLVLCLCFTFSCGGGGGDTSPASEPIIETRGDVATLSSNASRETQPHYQYLEILPTSYVQLKNSPKHTLKGNMKLIYSLYSGSVPQQYSNYSIYKYDASLNVTDLTSNETFNVATTSLVTELENGAYCLGGSDLADLENIVWETSPVLMGFRTYEIGASLSFESRSLGSGTMVIIEKNYVTVDNVKYPAWVVFSTQKVNGASCESYSWMNPKYGVIKMQLWETNADEGWSEFIELVRKESYSLP